MASIIQLTLQTLQFYRSVGVLRGTLRLMVSKDNEARLAWLEGALEWAFAHGQTTLAAYLEAVLEEVLFEIELDARP